jgi:hypothetical protein
MKQNFVGVELTNYVQFASYDISSVTHCWQRQHLQSEVVPRRIDPAVINYV